MPDKPSFEIDNNVVADHLLDLAARNAVLEAVLRQVTAMLFSGPGGDAALKAMRSNITDAFQFSAESPPDTDDEVAFEMQARAGQYARAFFDRAEATRHGIAAAGEFREGS